MEMAVKLHQSFDTLYNLEFMEYSMNLAILKRKIEEKSKGTETSSDPVHLDTSKPIKLDVPDHLKIE
jgi:hypothetical protein